MSAKTKKLPNCDDVDFMAPATWVMVFLKDEVLMNKIVSKKARLKDIFISGNLDPNGNYIMDDRPLDVNKTIMELLPKNADQLTEVKLIIEAIKLNLEDEKKEIYFEQVLKPFENPFRILVFTSKGFTASFQKYPVATLKKYGLENFSDSASAYCNTGKALYISGGKNRGKGTKDFLRICSLKLNIERLPDITIKKENHSMIYIPKNYIYFVGGNSKDTFFYDTSSNLFGDWAPLKQEKISPALALVNNRHLYAFTEQKEKKKFDFFERTDLKKIPEWEKITVKVVEPFPMHNFGAAVGNDGKVYFLGGRRDKGEKIYCYNTLKNIIEPCGQENSSLKIADKTFYFLNEYNSALIPNEIRDDVEIVLFNRTKNKFRKIHYAKDIEETIEVKNMSNTSGKVPEEKKNLKVYCKKTPLGKMPQIPEKLIKFPKIGDLKLNFGKDISVGLPNKSPIDIEIKKEIEPKEIDINIGASIPEINVNGPKIDIKGPSVDINLKGKPKMNLGLSFGKGKQPKSSEKGNPLLLRGILEASVDDPVRLNRTGYGLAPIRVQKTLGKNKTGKNKKGFGISVNMEPGMKRFETGIDIRGPNIDLDIKNDINGPTLDKKISDKGIKGPSIDVGIDLKGPKIGIPEIDIKGPKIGEPGIDIKGPKIGGPGIGLNIDINKPKVDLSGPDFGVGLTVKGAIEPDDKNT